MIEGAWAMVEMLGHRQIIGQLSEVTVAGAPMLRVDVPSEPPRTTLIAPASLYAITPISEEQARASASPRRELLASLNGYVDDDDEDLEDYQ